MKDMLSMFGLIWLIPWGLSSLALAFFGHYTLASLIGGGSALGLAFVFSLCRAAKGN